MTDNDIKLIQSIHGAIDDDAAKSVLSSLIGALMVDEQDILSRIVIESYTKDALVRVQVVQGAMK